MDILNKNYIILINQIIVSGSNFLTSILILRFLGIENFGVYSFLWLFLLFFNSIQLAYIISPLLTNAPKQKAKNLNFFYGHVFIQQFFFTLTIFIFSFCFSISNAFSSSCLFLSLPISAIEPVPANNLLGIC